MAERVGDGAPTANGELIDVHGGPYDQPVPDRDNVARTLDMMIEEGIAAEQSGFHSVHVPHRHGRTESYFPGPLQLLTILARETERVALGAFSMVTTLFHPMIIAEQGGVYRQLVPRTFFHRSRPRLSPRVLGLLWGPSGPSSETAHGGSPDHSRGDGVTTAKLA